MNTNNFTVTQDLLASKGKRFLNYIIDLVLQYAISYGLVYGLFYVGEFTGNYTMVSFLNGLSTMEDLVFSYVLLLLYYFIFETTTQRSLGKYATQTLVVMKDGSKPTTKSILYRSLSRLIPFDALSFLGVQSKGWHDSLSHTYVVDFEKFIAAQTMVSELDQIGIPIEQ